MKVLAGQSPRPLGRTADVPTLAEAGVPGFEMSTRYVAATSPTAAEGPVVARLQAETEESQVDVAGQAQRLGGEPGNLTPEQFAAYNRWSSNVASASSIRDANIKIDAQ